MPTAGSLTVWPSDSVASGSWAGRGAAVNPQDLNRYTYALNNPLKYTDPTGHWPRGIRTPCLCAGMGTFLKQAITQAARAVRQQRSTLGDRMRKIFDGALPNVTIEVTTTALDPETRNLKDITKAVGRGLTSTVSGNAATRGIDSPLREIVGAAVGNAAYDTVVDGQPSINSVRGDLGGSVIDTFFDSAAKDVQNGLEMTPVENDAAYTKRHQGLKGTGYALQVLVGTALPNE